MYDNFLNYLTTKINKLNPIIFVAVVLQIVLLAIIIIFIINITNTQTDTPDTNTDTRLTITNINQQIPNLPQSNYEEITFSLYDIAWINRSQDRELPTTLTATIRDNSITRQYFEDIDVHRVNFIIDLAELNQSYQVNYLWSKDQSNANIPANYKTMVYCLDQSNCTDRFAGTASRIITQSLPH